MIALWAFFEWMLRFTLQTHLVGCDPFGQAVLLPLDVSAGWRLGEGSQIHIHVLNSCRGLRGAWHKNEVCFLVWSIF